MKKNLFFFVLFIAIKMNAQNVITFDSITIQSSNSQPSNYITSVHSFNSPKADKNLYGFDITDLFYIMNNKSGNATQSTVFPNSSLVINNPTQLDSIYYYIKQLAPKTVRFCATSDWHHFTTTSKGMGADTAEYKRAFRLGLVSASDTSNVCNAFYKDKRYTRNFLYDLVRLVRRYQSETGDTIKIIYSANTFQNMLRVPTVTPTNANFTTLYNETYNAVKFLRDSGLIVYGVELGNEPYYKPLFWDNTKYNTTLNKSNYVAILKEYAIRLKNDFSGIFVSAPMTHSTGYSSPGNAGQLTVAIANDNSMFDAYSYHGYTGSFKNPNGLCGTYFSNSCLQYVLDANFPTLAQGYSTGISDRLGKVGNGSSCHTIGSDTYDYNVYRGLRLSAPFNSYNKKIWLSEWNLSANSSNGPEGIVLSNTLISGDFVFRNINFMLDNYDSLNFKVANFWGIGGGSDDLTPTATRNTQVYSTASGSSIGLCEQGKGQNFTYMNQSGINRVNLLSTYYPFKFISQIFSNNMAKVNATYNLTIPNNAQINEDNLMVRLYATNVVSNPSMSTVTRQFSLYLFYSNKTNQTITVNYDKFLNLTATNWRRFRIDTTIGISQESIQASSLTYFFRNSNYKLTGNGVSIAPYSIGYIRVPLITSITGVRKVINPVLEKSQYINPKSNYIVYPNPTSGIITFSVGNTDKKTLEIYNVEGKLIHQTIFDNESYKLDMSSYPKAQYIYKIIDGNTINSGKFIVE